jgi:hypothetical protein
MYHHIPLFWLVGAKVQRVANAPISLALKLLLVVSSSVSEMADPSTMSSHPHSTTRWKSRLLASGPPTQEFVRGPHIMSSCFPDVAPVSCFFLWCRCWLFSPSSDVAARLHLTPLCCCCIPVNTIIYYWPLVPYDRVLLSVSFLHGRSCTCGRRPTSSGTYHRPGSISLALNGALQLDVGVHISPPVLW